jgi:ABC-type nitrate/sulfonate/bicarbonate transport system ATPase subunit
MGQAEAMRLSIKALYKNFLMPKGRGIVEVLGGISLEVKKGSFVAILGPSGCGKTTFLRIISGLEPPTKGEIHLEGGKDSVGMVFQEFALFPWRSALGNIEFGLEFRNISKRERREKARNLIRLIGLEGFEGYYPYQLSGGMQQRVALARALILEPTIILMDEPFGSLDSQTRSDMQDFLLNLWEERQDTVVFVTHSVREAIKLSTELYLFSKRPARIVRHWDLAGLKASGFRPQDYLALEQEVLELLKKERAVV